jgi:hypothetical protein
MQMADYIKNERNVLDRLHHPGIAQLQFTFQVCGAIALVSRPCDACSSGGAAAAAAVSSYCVCVRLIAVLAVRFSIMVQLVQLAGLLRIVAPRSVLACYSSSIA